MIKLKIRRPNDSPRGFLRTVAKYQPPTAHNAARSERMKAMRARGWGSRYFVLMAAKVINVNADHAARSIPGSTDRAAASEARGVDSPSPRAAILRALTIGVWILAGLSVVFALQWARALLVPVIYGVLASYVLEPIVMDLDTWFRELDRFADVPFMEDGRRQPPMPAAENLLD